MSRAPFFLVFLSMCGISACSLFTNTPLATDPTDARSDGGATDVGVGGDDADVTGTVNSDVASLADTDPGCPFTCAPWDHCVGEKCVPKACASDATCMDGALPDDPAHFCVKGACAGYQCADDTDCGGALKCNTMTYTCYTPATGCVTDFLCADTDDCTNDICDHVTGLCGHKPKAGCCNTDKDCDDADPKTTDTCIAHHCDWKATALNACATAADCVYTNPCVSAPQCVGGQCTAQAVPNCCVSASDCVDNDELTTDICSPAHQCLHQFADLPTTCTSNATCPGNTCVSCLCIGTQATYTAIPGGVCCTSNTECQADQVCQTNQCTAHACTHTPSVGSGPKSWWHFDVGLDGWTVQKDHPTCYFHQTSLLYSAGQGALRYGVPGQVTFETGNANKGSAVSAVFTVPAGPSALTGWVYLDVEPGTAVHLAGIDVVSGGVTTPLWSKLKDLGGGTTQQTWKPVNADLTPWAGKSAQIRVWFDQLKYDTSNKTKMGFVVDELVVTGKCP